LTKLTEKQRKVLEFLRIFIAEKKTPPLIREVQEGCRISSYKSAVDRLNALERKGFIRRFPNKHRGIQLLRSNGERPRQTRLEEVLSHVDG